MPWASPHGPTHLDTKSLDVNVATAGLLKVRTQNAIRTDFFILRKVGNWGEGGWVEEGGTIRNMHAHDCFLSHTKCFAALCVAGGCSQDQSEVRL